MKFATLCILSKSIVILTYLSRSVLIPFFPLYIKYLNLSLIQMGIIRCFQVWTALIFITLSIKTGKKLSNNTLKRISISGSIFTTITICICLLFLPPNEYIKNVTHCMSNDVLDLQDLYNFHFKKSSYSIVQNNTNEFAIENDVYPTSININMQRNDFEEIDEQKEIEINVNERTYANKVSETPALLNSKIIDNMELKTQFVQTVNQNAIGKEISSRLGKNDQQSDPDIRESYVPYPNYDNSKATLMQETNVTANEVQTMKRRKDNEHSSSKPNLPSASNTFSRTSNRHISISLQKKPNSTAVAHNTVHFTQGNKQRDIFGSKMEDKINNAYNPTYNQERDSPIFTNNNQLNEINSRDIQNFNNIDKENSFSKTKILFAKHSKLNPDYNKQKNSGNNEDLRYKGEDVNSRRAEFVIPVHEQDEHFRPERSVAQSASSKVVKKYSSNNSSSPKNISVSFQNVEIPNKDSIHFSDKYHMWSETFVIALTLAVLYEIFSSQIVPWTEAFCYYNSYELNYDHLFASQIFMTKSLLWLISYPVVALLTTLTLCPYQIALHCFIAAMILVFAFLVALILLSLNYTETKHFRSRKLSKPPPMEKHLWESPLQRSFTAATNLLIGTCTACYVENILWYTDTLSGFPYNYEYLYCGHYFLNVLACLVTSRYLQYRNNSTTINNDSDSEEEYTHFSYEWFMKNKEIIYVEEQKSNISTVIGTVLLSVTLLVVPFLSSVWVLLPLALLKGMTDAFLETIVPQGCWSTLVFGYGFGCFVGSTIASIFGMKILFFSASIAMAICSFSWLCYSIFLRYFKRPYTRISLEGQNHEYSITEQTEDEEEDWLEKALQKDQFNQSKKLQQ